MKDCWWAINAQKPSTMQDIWDKNLPEISKQWSRRHKNVITKVSVGYLLRSFDFVQMTRILKMEQVPGNLADWRNLRLALLDDFRTVLGVKLMLARCTARACYNQRVKLESEIRDNNLLENDAKLFYALSDMQLRKPFIYTLSRIPALTIPKQSQVRKECEQALVNAKDFIDRFVARKLRFIYEGNNLQHSDIAGELNLIAARTFFHVTPFTSAEHRYNTVKRAAHNHGIKLIKYYTDPVRARKRKVGGAFINTVQTSNIISDDLDSEEENVTVLRMQANTDNLMEMRRYVDKYPRRIPIIRLLLLREDNEFLEDMETRLKTRFDSVEEIYDQLGSDAYYLSIAQHLDVSAKRVQKTVLDLRSLLVTS